jgi:hypothetical protein
VSRTEHFEQAYAVVRVDESQLEIGIPKDWSNVVTMKEEWWTVDEADAEVERLNRLANEKGVESTYQWQHVRVRRRSRCRSPQQ